MLTYKIDDSLELRLPEERDAEEFFALIDTNRTHLGQWMGWPATFTLAKSLPWTKEVRQEYVAQESLITLAVFQNKLAGAIGLARMDSANKRGELTYWIGRQFVGKGIVTKASSAILTYAFNSLDFYRIDAYCAVENTKSRAVAGRLGMEEEGVVRGHRQFQGQPLDHVLYSIIKPEWNE